MPTILSSGPDRANFYSHQSNELPRFHVDRDKATCKVRLVPVELALNLVCHSRVLRELERFVSLGIMAPDAERHGVFYGRRARPAIKPRFIQAQLAYQLARKLQAKRLGTMAVL
jgi:hypothetical protein